MDMQNRNDGPAHSGDATICSNDSAFGTASLVNSQAKQDGKVKAYVDFTIFNRNYENFKRTGGSVPTGRLNQKTGSAGSRKEDNNSNINKNTDDWTVLSYICLDILGVFFDFSHRCFVSFSV